jgi:hypothetical protein
MASPNQAAKQNIANRRHVGMTVQLSTAIERYRVWGGFDNESAAVRALIELGIDVMARGPMTRKGFRPYDTDFDRVLAGAGLPPRSSNQGWIRGKPLGRPNGFKQQHVFCPEDP